MDKALTLLAAWLADRILGDPAWLPHPVVGFGKLIAAGEKRWNRGTHRRRKGAWMAILLVAGTFVVTFALLLGLRRLGQAMGCGVSCWGR